MVLSRCRDRHPARKAGDIRPCIRQRPFGIAGDCHRLPLLVRAASARFGRLAIHGALGYFASLPRAAQHISAKPDTITSQSAIRSTTHLL
jgi:hypothetical protein